MGIREIILVQAIDKAAEQGDTTLLQVFSEWAAIAKKSDSFTDIEGGGAIVRLALDYVRGARIDSSQS